MEYIQLANMLIINLLFVPCVSLFVYACTDSMTISCTLQSPYVKMMSLFSFKTLTSVCETLTPVTEAWLPAPTL